jgi:hypothetical protein
LFLLDLGEPGSAPRAPYEPVAGELDVSGDPA